MREISEYIVSFSYRAKPGRAAELAKELRDRISITRREAGNLDFRLYCSTTDDHVFFVFSRYSSEQQFDIHLYQPYIVSLLAKLDDICAIAPRVETYQPMACP